MQTRMNHLKALALALVLIAFLAGCLVSGTKAFSFEVGNIVADGTTFERVLIDLGEEDDYADYEEEIRNIDRFGWTCRVVNDNPTALRVSVYVSERADLTDEEVPALATPVFVDFEVAGSSSRIITFDQALELLPRSSFPEIRRLIEIGVFTLYATTNAGFTVRIDDLELIIIFTVGL